MTTSLMKLSVAAATLGALGVTPWCTAQPDDSRGPDARFVAELIGLDYCEVLPADMPEADLQEGLAAMREQGIPLVTATVSGFMDNASVGDSLFGTSDGDTSFTAVHSLWGTLPDGRRATLCLHTVQIGDVAAVTGQYSAIGLAALEEATEGQMILSGIVAVLEDTGRRNERDQRVLRQRTIGDIHFDNGSVTLDTLGDEGYAGSLTAQGTVLLEDAEPQSLRLELTIDGVRALERVPTLTQ
jgi:hypothetical protein